MQLSTAFSQIDRNSPIPLYAQLKSILQALIEQGSFQPGDRLPSELDLCQLSDVSRIVVRQALAELAQEGYIIRRQGLGSFIAEPKIKESLVQKLTGFHHDMVDQGLTPHTTVLRQGRRPASARIASRLGIPTGTEILRIERVRSIGNEPIVYVVTHLPADLCPALEKADLSHQSLYALLEDLCQIHIDRGQRSIEAVPAGAHEAELLGIQPGAPLLQLDSISFLPNGKAVEYYRAYHRGDRSRFDVQLVRVPEHSPRASELKRAGIELPSGNTIAEYPRE